MLRWVSKRIVNLSSLQSGWQKSWIDWSLIAEAWELMSCCYKRFVLNSLPWIMSSLFLFGYPSLMIFPASDACRGGAYGAVRIKLSKLLHIEWVWRYSKCIEMQLNDGYCPSGLFVVRFMRSFYLHNLNVGKKKPLHWRGFLLRTKHISQEKAMHQSHHKQSRRTVNIA